MFYIHYKDKAFFTYGIDRVWVSIYQTKVHFLDLLDELVSAKTEMNIIAIAVLSAI